MQTVRGWFGKAPKAPATDGSDIGMAVGAGRAPTKKATAETLAAYSYAPWLRAVTSRIADAVASTEWSISVPERGDDKKEAYLHRSARRGNKKALEALQRKGELREIDDHPLLELMHYGNPRLDGEACMFVTQLHLDHMGEAFWALDMGALGKPVAFWPMPPSWIESTPSEGDQTYAVKIRGTRVKMPADRMVWFKNPDPADPYARGSGLAFALSDELDTDEYAAAFIKTFFYNDAGVSAVVALKGAKDAQVKEIEAKWNQKFRGAGNAHRTAFTSADIDVKILQQSFKDMNIVELRKFLRDIVIQVFGVPPEILGIVENSNRATIDGALVIFAKFVLVPRLNRLRAIIQEKIVKLFDERLILSYESPVPADRAHQLAVMGRAPSAFSVAEWRQLAGFEPRPGDENETIAPTPAPTAPGQEPDSPPADKPAGRKPREPAASDEEDAPAKRRSKAFGADDADDVANALDPVDLSAEIDPVFKARVDEWGNAMLDDLGIGARFNMLNPLVTEHLAELSGERITGINNTTREAIREVLIEGVAAGEGIDDLAARVEAVFEDAVGSRAESIARTEVLRSSNFAQWEAQVQSEIVARRQWVSTRDTATRPEHIDLDGDVRELYEPFTIEGSNGMHPGDFGVAEYDINCRCTTVPLVGDEEPKSTDALDMVWKKYDQNVRPWERETERALRRGFDKQLESALAALRGA